MATDRSRDYLNSNQRCELTASEYYTVMQNMKPIKYIKIMRILMSIAVYRNNHIAQITCWY